MSMRIHSCLKQIGAQPLQFIHHFAGVAAEEAETDHAHQDRQRGDRPQAVPVGPLPIDQDDLKGSHQARHGVEVDVGLQLRREDAGRVNNRGKPEPELEKYPEKLADIPEKDVQHTQRDTEADGEGNHNGEQGKYRQIREAGEVAGEHQECGKQPEYDDEVEPGIGDDDNRQTQARKTEFLEQVGVFEEGVLRAADDFRKQTPRQDASAEKNAVGKSRIHPGQFGLHDLRKNHRVDDDHGQRVDDRPRSAKQRIPVFGLELPLDAAEDETAVGPERAEHTGHQRLTPITSSISRTRVATNSASARDSTLRRSSGSVFEERRLRRQSANSRPRPSVRSTVGFRLAKCASTWLIAALASATW